MLPETTGHVQIDVPADRDSTFEPQIVRKRQRRLTRVDEIVLSLYAKGLTTGEISAHFAEIYGASVSKETVSRITDKVASWAAWASRSDRLGLHSDLDVVVPVSVDFVETETAVELVGARIDGQNIEYQG
ncbi:transposase-like protein [Nocardia sp. GAS34]